MRIILIFILFILCGCKKEDEFVHAPLSYLTPTYNIQTTINEKTELNLKEQGKKDEKDLQKIIDDMKRDKK